MFSLQSSSFVSAVNKGIPNSSTSVNNAGTSSSSNSSSSAKSLKLSTSGGSSRTSAQNMAYNMGSKSFGWKSKLFKSVIR